MTSRLRAAHRVLNAVLSKTAVLSAIAIGGGILAMILNRYSPTSIDIMGAEVNTGHVGVAFAALGLLCMLFTGLGVLRYSYKLASLPNKDRR